MMIKLGHKGMSILTPESHIFCLSRRCPYLIFLLHLARLLEKWVRGSLNFFKTKMLLFSSRDLPVLVLLHGKHFYEDS